jgi:hypothetical protein
MLDYMKRVYKGDFGHILYQRKVAIVRSLIMGGVILGLFIIGLLITKTNKNIFSIVAALGCLPLGWSIINLIMYYRAIPLARSSYEKITAHAGSLNMIYDLSLTSEKSTYNVGAITVLEKNIAGYTEDKDMDIQDCQEHIKNQISLSKYHDYTIKIFRNVDEYCRRLDQLEKLRKDHNIDPKAIEDAWVPGTIQTVSGILESISL